MQDVSLIIGPGQYGDIIAGALSDSNLLNQVMRTFPELRVDRVAKSNRQEKVISSFGLLQRIVWASWRRIPHYRNFETPSGYLQPFADHLLAKHLEPCRLLIGWSQVSLASMKRGHGLGAKVMLEHQMASVWKWMELVSEEYKKWGSGRQGFYSLFSDRQVARMEAEYDEADLINVLSSYAKNSFVEHGVDEAKINVTPFGVDTSRFYPDPSSRSRDKIRILYVGRLELLKGIQYLLEAFTQIKDKRLELRLVGPVLPEIAAILSKFADDRIDIMGPVASESIPKIYREADIFVFPSINDAFGLVVIEAMASGVPVITTEHSCATDVVNNMEDGIIVPIRDHRSIKEAIEMLVDDPARREVMALKCREKVQAHFRLEQFTQRYTQLCSGLSGGS